MFKDTILKRFLPNKTNQTESGCCIFHVIPLLKQQLPVGKGMQQLNPKGNIVNIIPKASSMCLGTENPSKMAFLWGSCYTNISAPLLPSSPLASPFNAPLDAEVGTPPCPAPRVVLLSLASNHENLVLSRGSWAKWSSYKQIQTTGTLRVRFR